MSDTVETRIKLPTEVHRSVKAEAARQGITLAEALGMCVAFIVGICRPLAWRDDIEEVGAGFEHWLNHNFYPE